jgi:hypothetical protein
MPGSRSEQREVMRGQRPTTPWDSKSQSVNQAPNAATETCPYCGAAVRRGGEECPTEFIHRAADALTGETT